MATLMFLPNDHLLAWIYQAQGQSPARVVRMVASGAWPFPPEWRTMLEKQFIVPDEMRLLAHAHSDLVVIYPNVSLKERVPGRRLLLSPGQAQVLTLMARGLTTRQIAYSLRVKPRWIKYRVAEVKRRLGALNRAEAVKRGLEEK